MDALGSREALLDSKRLDSAIAAAQIDQKAASTGQVSLFDMFGEADSPVLTASVAAPSVDGSVGGPSKERALWEKEVLGFQFGDHPFMEALPWLATRLSHDTSQLSAELSGDKVTIGGLVTGVRRIMTKTKSQMAVLTLEDLHGSIEAVVFPRVYERAADVLREDAILIIEGKVDTRGDRPQIVVDRAEAWTAPPKGSPPPPPLAVRPSPAPSTPVEAPDATRLPAEGQTSPKHRTQPVATAVTQPNGHASAAAGNSAAAGGNGHEAAVRRVLRVVVPRGPDDNACVRVLEQLHGLVERFPGSDLIQLVLHDRAGCKIELAGADIPVRHSADLELQVRTLVGADNLQVQPSAEPYVTA
jgi:DNA polymerase III subunit alpha